MDKFILKYANLSYSIKDVQKRLNFLGYPTVEDGVLGEKTKQSIKNFQKDNRLLQTGEITDGLIKFLFEIDTNKGFADSRERISDKYKEIYSYSFNLLNELSKISDKNIYPQGVKTVLFYINSLKKSLNECIKTAAFFDQEAFKYKLAIEQTSNRKLSTDELSVYNSYKETKQKCLNFAEQIRGVFNTILQHQTDVNILNAIKDVPNDILGKSLNTLDTSSLKTVFVEETEKGYKRI